VIGAAGASKRRAGLPAERRPEMYYPQPSRLPAAFAAAGASAVAVLVATAVADALFNSGGAVPDISFGPFILVAAFIVAAFHAIVVGLPAHALLPRRWRYSLRANAAGGFLVGGLPLPLLVLSFSGGDRDEPWLDYLAWLAGAAGALGLFGMAGGAVFWLIIREHAVE
jgi:hypothetical protein